MYKQLLLIFGVTSTITASTPILRSSCIKLGHTSVKDLAATSHAIEHIKKQAHLILITRKNQHACWQQSEKDKEEVRQILASFAAIMKCFFDIVQDPENRQNVTAGLGGIFYHLVTAGKVIMRGSDILLDDDKEIVEEWLHTAALQEICTIITRTNKQ